MDNKSLQQIIERIPELNSNTLDRFRQISLQIYPNSALQSLTLLRVKKSVNIGYDYADSLARSVTHYKFLVKKYQKTIHRPLHKMQNFCRFYANFAAFQLFFQTNLNNIHDVHVLNFMSNYM